MITDVKMETTDYTDLHGYFFGRKKTTITDEAARILRSLSCLF